VLLTYCGDYGSHGSGIQSKCGSAGYDNTCGSEETIGPVVKIGNVVRDLGKEERNKEIVVKFYTQLFRDRNFTGIADYISPDSIQHDPNFPIGKDANVARIRNWILTNPTPNPRLVIERAVAEGDLVWLHVLTNVERILNPGNDFVAVEIYRLKNFQLVEHWDVSQAIPQWSDNQSPLLNVLEDQFRPQCGYSRD